MAALFLIYKERARYQLSEIVIKEFVNRSSLPSPVTYYLASTELSQMLIRMKTDLSRILKAEDVAVLVYDRQSRPAVTRFGLQQLESYLFAERLARHPVHRAQPLQLAGRPHWASLGHRHAFLLGQSSQRPGLRAAVRQHLSSSLASGSSTCSTI